MGVMLLVLMDIHGLFQHWHRANGLVSAEGEGKIGKEGMSGVQRLNFDALA